jgi:hypothetical protein
MAMKLPQGKFKNKSSPATAAMLDVFFQKEIFSYTPYTLWDVLDGKKKHA